jgi:hypothetical protein
MNAGLSRKRAAFRRMYSVTVTSGIVTAGLSLLMIIALPRPKNCCTVGLGTVRQGGG